MVVRNLFSFDLTGVFVVEMTELNDLKSVNVDLDVSVVPTVVLDEL